MRRMAVLLACLALLLPLAVRADIIIINQGGTITLLQSGITSQQSRLIQFQNIKSDKGHALGHVDFATGALTSGTLLGGGIFSSSGSSFVVTGDGAKGVPKGVIFSGTFVGDITWTLVQGLPAKPQIYKLTGNLIGQLYTGRTVSGTTTQNVYIYYHQVIQDHKGSLHIGTTQLNAPEPGTLSLLGIGLIAVASCVRYRFAS